MKASELRQKDKTELQALLVAESRQHFVNRMHKGEEGQKTHQFKLMRRNIARILTILKEKEASV